MELDLNPTYQSICHLIGEQNALILSLNFGGINMEIPKRATNYCQLTKVIGLDNATKIINIYGGMRFYVPLTQGRHSRVIRFRKEGFTLSQIANKEKIALRTVAIILSDEALKNQLDLFQ